MIEKMRVSNGLPSEDDLMYSSVDVLRYVMSMLNLWEIPPEEVSKAFMLKDLYLDIEHKINANKWEGQPVVVVDIDDVLAEFRTPFAEFLNRRYAIEADVDSDQYFFVEDILKASGNINPEKVFESFVQERQFRCLPLVENAFEFLSDLRQKGYWIQLLTARPKEDLKIFYDTYSWLNQTDLVFDRVDFSPEKLRWCMNSEYYDSGSIVYAIDDSPKHALEYAGHGINVKVPIKSYNKDIKNDNITFYDSLTDIMGD
jgi:phosphoglycolate phosphatase-like HAD superfamily hydrolase